MRKIITLVFLIGIQFCSIGQNLAELNAELTKKFPNDSIVGDNVWAFYEETANIKKLNKPLVRGILNGYELYKATLTNFLGYHIEDAECLIIYNPKTSELELFPPIWFDGSMEKFVTKFIDARFESNSELKKFVSEMQSILLIGSSSKTFENTKFSSEKITFDLMETNNSKKKIWRKIKIEIEENRILSYTSDFP